MAEREGFERPIQPNENGVSEGVLTQDLTHVPALCPELCEIAENWDSLPEHIRLSVLALVRTVKGGGA